MKGFVIKIFVVGMVNLLFATIVLSQDLQLTKRHNKKQINIEMTKAQTVVKGFIRAIFMDRKPIIAFRNYFDLNELDKHDEAFLSFMGRRESIPRKFTAYNDDALYARFWADVWLSEYAPIYLVLHQGKTDG